MPCDCLPRCVLELMLKVFAPNDERLLVREACMPSTAVRTPTSAVMPMVTIQAVMMDRRRFALTDRKPSLKFSIKFMEQKQILRPYTLILQA